MEALGEVELRANRRSRARWNTTGVAQRLVQAGRDEAARHVLMPKARHGHPSACAALGRLLFFGDKAIRRPLDGIHWLRRAVRGGDADAMADLARIGFVGRRPFFEEIPSAPRRLRYIRRAAARGAAEAQQALASAYSSGTPLAADPARARYWYECAAKQGLPAAMYSLGMMVLTGDGGRCDAVAAARWLHACASGDVRDWPYSWFAADVLSAIYAGEHGGALMDSGAQRYWENVAERLESAADDLLAGVR